MKTLVIGAGVSGLATAWFLREAGANVHVIEAGPRPGGLIQTQHVPEGLIETAARAFTWTPGVEALFTAAGVTPMFARTESKRRYILRNGVPRRWPLSPMETLQFGAHLGSAWVLRRTAAQDAESVAEWGTRVIGRSATTWLLAPALQGIYASAPADLSAAAIFGKDRPKGGKLAAPAGGMGELMDRLHRALQARGVSFEFGRDARSEDIDAAAPTVVCTNAPAAARLLAPHAPKVSAAIARIRMVSMLAVHAFFAPHPDDIRGFGILFPRASGMTALGAVFNADVFAERSPMRAETWMYGSADASALPHDAGALDQMLSDRSVLTGRQEAPAASYITRQPAALPVYDQAILDARAALADLPPYLAIAGNYLGRLGVSNLISGAADAASRIRSRTGLH